MAIRARAASVAPPEFARQSRVPASRLQQLGRGEFVLVVRRPERLVATARTVPASIPEPPADAAGAPPAVTLARLPAQESA
jgi:hypothetical protein